MRDEGVIHCPLHGTVEITPCDPAEIAPLVAHLEADLPVAQQTTFPRGTMTEQGQLDLCKQKIGPVGCRLVTEALAANTTVTSLLLGTDGIGDEGAAHVARLIERNARLEIVYLGCNRIGESGVAALADTLAKNRSVQGLWLKRNPVGLTGARSLAAMLRRNRSLRTLDLVNTHLGEDGLMEIIEALLHENRTVERLYVGANGIGAQGARQLAALLRENPAIKALLLGVNHIGDAGAISLADALRENRTLTELGLASNDIMAKGGAALLEAAQSHPALTHLDFGYSPSTRVLGAYPNGLGDVGAEAAGRFLAGNRTLLRLDLRHNGITEVGKAQIISGLEQNTTLLHLFLDGKQDPRILALLERNGALHPSPSQLVTRDVELIRSVYRTAAPALQ